MKLDREAERVTTNLPGDQVLCIVGPYRDLASPTPIVEFQRTCKSSAGHVHAPTKCTPILHQKSQILHSSSHAGITATSLQIGTYIEVAIETL